ncbi:MAG: hypothetical protein IKX34_05945 [Bacteroidales bacterium]|nr:hypothetical protein [Bacteroidales bacterium]
MFAFPVVVALLDKRAKQKRAASQPTPRPRPTFPSSSPAARELARNDGRSADGAAGGVAPGPDAASECRDSSLSLPSGKEGNRRLNRATLGTVRGGTASEAQRWGPTKEDVSGGKLRSSPDQEQSEEGVRAIHRKKKETNVEKQPADKLKIDPKKLILYSEILKPKYDA